MKMNKNTKITIVVGVLFVVGLLTMSYLYNPSPKITTPEQDAKLLADKAMTIRTEIDLRNLEKLAIEYEIAYKNSYGGAKAMYFKSLVEPILVAAGDRRDAIREAEDHLRNEQRKFHSMLNDMDEAWSINLGTDADVEAKIRANEERVYALEADIAELQLRKEQLGEEAWSGEGGSLNKDCLDEIGRVEEKVEKYTASVERINHETAIIMLAYRLQRGEEFVLSTVEVAEVAETEVLVVEE